MTGRLPHADHSRGVRVLAALAVATLVLCVAVAAPAAALQDDTGDEEPPSVPAAYHGTVTIGDEPAPAGTEVAAVVNGTTVATIQTDENGTFGSAAAAEASLVVAASPGDEVAFRVGGDRADLEGAGDALAWEAGAVQSVALSVEGDDGSDGGSGGGGGGGGVPGFSLPSSPAPEPGGGGVSGGEPDVRLTDVEPTNATVVAGETYVVTGTVSNEGDGSGTATVELRLGGETVRTETVTVAAGGEKTVSASVETGDREPGVYRVEVEAAGQTEQGTLYVTRAPSDPEDDSTDDGRSGDDSTPGFGLVAAALALLAVAAASGRQRAR